MAGGLTLVDGLLTWGGGSAPALDPPFSSSSMPTLAGGTIGRPITGRGPGRWLLDLDFGGSLWRISTEQVTPSSRVRGDRVVYLPGLEDLEWEIGADEASITLRAGEPGTWAQARRVLGPLRGRRFVLRYWFAGQVLEDAYVALQGVVEQASFGDPDDPYALQLSCARNLDALSREMLSPTAKLDRSTFSGLIGDVPEEGPYYPLVLGCPGAAAVGGTVTPATPGLLVNYTLTQRLLIAGHHVAATHVWVFDITAGRVEERPVTNEYDDRGQEVATVSIGSTTIPIDETHEYAIGWDRVRGGGLRHRGREMTGLGDLLQWGADTLSSAIYDAGEMSAHRAALNRFRVDTLINEQISWTEWLDSNVMSIFELAEVEGPRGVYYEEIRYRADRRLRRATLSTSPAHGGYRVQRVSPVTESDEEIFNAITVAYVPFAESHTQFLQIVTVDPNPRRGLQLEDVLLRDPRCSYSARMFGRREATWETAITADRATAVAIAHSKAARHAIPKILVSYEGGRDLLDLRKYETVELYDSSPGAAFEGDLALVQSIRVIDGETVSVALAVDTDPLQHPTVGG